LGRAQAFQGDLEGGLGIIRASLTTLDEIGSQYESLEAYARLAEVLAFGERTADAREALARARPLQRDVGETWISSLIERVELTLAASEGSLDWASTVADFCARAGEFGAPYEELVVLALAERHGDVTHHKELERLISDLGVVRLPMFSTA
jgi:hypothetical protein